MAIRVVGDDRDSSVYNIPSDSNNRDIRMDVSVTASGAFHLTLRDRSTGEKLDFRLEGVGGGSQNRHLGPVFADFGRRLAQQERSRLQD